MAVISRIDWHIKISVLISIKQIQNILINVSSGIDKVQIFIYTHTFIQSFSSSVTLCLITQHIYYMLNIKMGNDPRLAGLTIKSQRNLTPLKTAAPHTTVVLMVNLHQQQVIAKEQQC